MLEIFQYDFMQRAFIVAILVSIITPCIGVIVVLKRLSMIGDSLSHASLAGVAAGLIMGINPILGATTFSVAAALSIERLRKSFPRYSEIAIAVLMSTGIGLAGVLSKFVKNSANFMSFLFGSIVAISDFELFLVIGLSAVVIMALIFLYKELFYITFDEEAAKLAGIPVSMINFLFVLLTAITISISARIVGTLVISSLMVLPVAAAMQMSKSYKQTVVYSVVFALVETVAGLVLSYYADLNPGGTIVLVAVFMLLLAIFYTNVVKSAILRMSANTEL